MPDPTGYAVAEEIRTDFKDFAKYPIHLLGQNVKKQPTPLTFDQIYSATGKVIIRDDIFDGTGKVPCALKVHNPGQIISRFTTNSSYVAAIAHGVYFNMVMNPVMHGYSGNNFIDGTVRYSTWRLRGKDRTSGTWHVGAGYGVHSDGVDLNFLYQILVPGEDPIFVLSADFTVGATEGDVDWQLEVGFGSPSDAIAAVTTEAATAAWPAFG